MKARTEEFLMVLLWAAGTAMVPTWRNLDMSFEGWAYRNGFKARLDYLEREKFLERRRDAATRECVYRLSALGRLAALGGRDAEERWGRAWDGRWRMVLFDLPGGDQALRVSLLRWLRANNFGYLQNSLWITPDPLEEVVGKWTAGNQSVEAFVLFEGMPMRGATDADIVLGAWDFEKINSLYRAYLDHAGDPPSPDGETPLALLKDWLSAEQRLWNAAVRADPLLPQMLLPRGYEGRNAWKQRKRAWQRIRPQLREVRG